MRLLHHNNGTLITLITLILVALSVFICVISVPSSIMMDSFKDGLPELKKQYAEQTNYPHLAMMKTDLEELAKYV